MLKKITAIAKPEHVDQLWLFHDIITIGGTVYSLKCKFSLGILHVTEGKEEDLQAFFKKLQESPTCDLFSDITMFEAVSVG